MTVDQDKPAAANPDFDHDRVVWDDAYSGQYPPVPYEEQFDEQWKLYLDKTLGFHNHTGVETSDAWIDDRIEELTGVGGAIERRKFGITYPLIRLWRRLTGAATAKTIGGTLHLEPKFPIDFFQGKRCLDIGCGAGRWTRALIELGAQVKSVDVSEHGLESTRRFNSDTERLDLFDIIPARKDLHGVMDFTLCWGVVMCTHDPKLAFENAAMTVRPNGHLYTMIYAPTYHNSPQVRQWRRCYHREKRTIEEKIDYVYEIADRPENAINVMDMLNTFYNWTIPEDLIHDWYRRCGFEDVITLNRNEPHHCAYHVLGQKKG